MTDGPGPTGEFPRGPLNASDEGAIRVAVAADARRNVVIVNFGTPVVWFAMPPAEVRALAALLHDAADELEPDAPAPERVAMSLTPAPLPPYPPGMLRAEDLRWSVRGVTEVLDERLHRDAIDVEFTVEPLAPPPRRQLQSWQALETARTREPGEDG